MLRRPHLGGALALALLAPPLRRRFEKLLTEVYVRLLSPALRRPLRAIVSSIYSRWMYLDYYRAVELNDNEWGNMAARTHLNAEDAATLVGQITDVTVADFDERRRIDIDGVGGACPKSPRCRPCAEPTCLRVPRPQSTRSSMARDISSRSGALQVRRRRIRSARWLTHCCWMR